MTGRTTAPGDSRTPTSAAYRAYHSALGVFLVCGAVQVFLAGLGVFSAGEGPGLDPHRWFALVLAAVALVVVVLAAVARAGTRTIVLSAVVFLLTFLLQGFLAVWGRDSAWFGGLHALDGLLLIGLAAYLFVSSGGPIGRR
jgi:Family of unknown function (DUF6220)